LLALESTEKGGITVRHLKNLTAPRSADLTPDQTIKAFFLDLALAVLRLFQRR
jgi:hypothetical protein